MVPYQTGEEWERAWAPYDEATYQAVLAHIDAADAVLEIGAGDLRLARRLAAQARQVYAVEIQPGERWGAGLPLPANLTLIQADARQISFPAGLTVGVLLMRHCTCFSLYADKLRQAGATRLITNARWRLGVELIYLNDPGTAFTDLAIGWYACRCGQTGFVPGPPEALTAQVERQIRQVYACPACQ